MERMQNGARYKAQKGGQSRWGKQGARAGCGSNGNVPLALAKRETHKVSHGIIMKPLVSAACSHHASTLHQETACLSSAMKSHVPCIPGPNPHVFSAVAKNFSHC